MSDCYYVYIVKHKYTKEFYIGCRHGLKKPPDKDKSYIGSGVWCLGFNAKTRRFLEKTVLLVFTSRRTARAFEWILICANKGNPLCTNRSGHDRKRKERYRRHQRIIELHREGMSREGIYDSQDRPGAYTRGTIGYICCCADKGILLATSPSDAHATKS
jgi:hypothetical protein